MKSSISGSCSKSVEDEREDQDMSIFQQTFKASLRLETHSKATTLFLPLKREQGGSNSNPFDSVSPNLFRSLLSVDVGG